MKKYISPTTDPLSGYSTKVLDRRFITDEEYGTVKGCSEVTTASLGTANDISFFEDEEPVEWPHYSIWDE